ncbi:MAG TPA: hypothetical protein VK272_11740 [Solirubrobacteraceae bacterium]|nr:hypothetical protein [Solirubrobacteraceae bacterium]
MQATLEGHGSAPGTCGEFAQGPLPNGAQFHVTCPIDERSSVSVELCEAAEYSVSGLSAHQHKLQRALRYTCEHLDLGKVAIRVRHRSDLDVAKGMGSSTADVLAGIRAIATAVGTQLTPAIEGRLATRVESSDGTMYRGITVANQKTGAELRRWAWYPEFVIVMLVPHDSVITETASFAGKEVLAREYEALLGEFDQAIERRSISEFAALSTRAATLNAAYVPNPYAELLARRLSELGALGLNVGHSGTVCGILYPNTEQGRARAGEVRLRLRRGFAALRDVRLVRTPACPSS